MTKTLKHFLLDELRGVNNIQRIQGLHRGLFKPFEDLVEKSWNSRGYEVPDLPAFIAHVYGFHPQLTYDDCYWFPFADYISQVVIPHKIEVWKAGMRLIQLFSDQDQLDWIERLFVHDASKFSHREWIAYDAQKKAGFDKPKSTQFLEALNHHYNHNDHHPEHWILNLRGQEPQALKMPIMAVHEMVCDWIGSSKSYGDDMQEWLDKNFNTFNLHPETKQDAIRTLRYLGYKV